MYRAVPVVAAVAVLAVQLALCWGTKRVWLRLLPTLLLAAGAIVSLLFFAGVLGSGNSILFPAASQLAGFIALILLGICLAADGVAWVVWAILRKRR